MSKQPYQVGNLNVLPGAKGRGYLEVHGTNVHLPLTVINGAFTGRTVLISGGVHGGEYPGIEAAIRLSRELDPALVRGQIVVMPQVSPLAFYARQQYVVPQDGKNLNRQFPGSALGTITERIAHTIMSQVVSTVDAWVDLHGGDIHEALVPFVIYSDGASAHVRAVSRAMAEVYGIDYVVASHAGTSGTYGAAAAAGVPCILAEAGQLGQLDEPSVERHVRGCHNILRHLEVISGALERVRPIVLMGGFEWLRAARTGCWYPVVRAGQSVREGQLVGSIKDHFGEILEEYRAPAAGVALFVVVSLAINEGDPLLGIGVQ